LTGRRTRRGWRGTAIAGLALIACGALGAPASADGGHLPGFSVADQRVAISKLPESVGDFFGGIPGVERPLLPHVGHGPVWFGEVQRPERTIDIAGNGQWVCAGEMRSAEGGGSGSCTTPAAAREFALLDVGSCGKGRPRHFRVFALLPDGVDSVEIEKAGGAIGRTLPVFENTIAFTVGREDIVLHALGDPSVEGLGRTLPLAQASKLGGDSRGGCAFYAFAEAKKPDQRPGVR
jgi:hypothetical protein